MADKVVTAVPDTLRNFDALPDSAEVRAPTLKALLGVSIATVWRWSAAGILPAPRKRGPRVTSWNVGEVRAALAEQKAAA